MQEIITERLKIVPLGLEDLGLLLTGMEHLEKRMGLLPSNAVLDEHTQAAMKELYEKASADKVNHIWHTCWQIILLSDNVSIGSACFKNSPDNDGSVEIGYGIDESYRNMGYMTEAALAMIQWAVSQPGVKTIMAETEKDNPASHRVLKKCGLEQFRETAQCLWWKYEKVLLSSR